MDRRHAADIVAKRASLKEEWLKLSRVLANMRNRRGKLMPGWITLQHNKPIYTIKSQLVQWRKLRRMQVATDGQRGITSYFSHLTRTTILQTRAARSATTPDDGSAAAATAATSPAATTARQAETVATASQLRRQALERTTEQKSKRRRQHQHDDDDPDGATSESPALTGIDSTCADHGASAASAALPRATTAAPQAVPMATAESPKRQLTVAESFQRTTRRRAGDPGAAARPLPDMPHRRSRRPQLTTQTPSLHLSLHRPR